MGKPIEKQKVKSINKQSVFKIQVLVIILFSIGLYANTLFYDYTLDDTLMITQNKFTKMGVSGIGKIMSNDSFVGFFGKNKNLLPGGRYRPLSQVLFALEYQFFGLKPFIGHLMNILLYSLLCVFLFILLNKIFENWEPGVRSSQIKSSNRLIIKLSNYLSLPFIITLIFTVHPLHTEVVANIKGCDEILGLILICITMLLILKYLDNFSKVSSLRKVLIIISISAVFLLALINKENAVTFIALIPLTIFVFRKVNFKDHSIVFLSLIISFIAYLFIRYEALGFIFSNNAYERELLNNPFIKADAAEKYATIMLTWGKYLLLLIFPNNLTHDYYPKHIPIINWNDYRAILPLLIYAGLIFYSLFVIIKQKSSNHQIIKSSNIIIAYGILVYMITFSIQSNLVFNIGTFMNERFMFISLLGYCIVISYLILTKIRSAKIKIILLLHIIPMYSYKTISRNTAWKNDFTLFTTDVKTSYNSAKCNVSAGGMYFEKAKKEADSLTKRGMLEQAQYYITQGITIHPYYIAGWVLSGNVYLEMKDYKQAMYCYETILKLSPLHHDALNNLLYVAQQTDKEGLIKESLSAYKTLYKYKPGDTDYLFNLASGLARNGRSDTALVILNKIAAAKPNYYNAYNKMGEIYGRYFNDINKSITYLNKANSINGKDPSVLENLGVAYGIKGDYPKSIEYFNKALIVKPDNPGLYNNLAGSYRNIGNIDMANQMISKAKKMQKKK